MLDLPVPSPAPPGPYGTMAWLRATVSRFSGGDAHARRRAIASALLDTLDPEELRAGAVVAVPLAGRPFGAGPRRCPGEAHARALAAGVIEGARGEAPAEVAR